MLTARRAFGGDTEASVISAIMTGEPPPLSSLQPLTPPALDRLVRRCLAKDPDDRWQTAADVAEDLRGISQDAVATDSVLAVMPRRRRRLVWTLAAGAALLLAVGLVAGLRFAHFGSTPASPLRLTLSFPAEEALVTEDYNPLALSPDGKTLVYRGVTNSKRQLFLRRLDRNEIRPIPDTDWALAPFFSPDGLEVGFFDIMEGKLKKVALAGGGPTTLCAAPVPRGASWGPDGTIVFTPDMKSGLWRIPASGGEPRAVTRPDKAAVARHLFPQVLPDGDHVLFWIRDETRASRVAVVSLRTGEQRILVENAYDARYLPTGHLLFSRNGALFAVPFDLKRLAASGPPVMLLDDVFRTNLGFEYAVSADGTLVYVPALVPRRTLVWVDRRGAAEPVPLLPPGGYGTVALSPDGGRVAAVIEEKGQATGLAVGDLARGTLSHSTAEGQFSSAIWAPDGTRLAVSFAPSRPGQAPELIGAFWQSTDLSTPPKRLTSESAHQEEAPTSFSPDGRWLLVYVSSFSDTSAAHSLFVQELTGTRPFRPFLQGKAYYGNGRFSPDGQWVAYDSDESDASNFPEVFVRRFPGPGSKWQISSDGGMNPVWSRSGRELFYWNWKDDKLMAVDVETTPTFRAGRPRVLFPAHASDYDIAPDGLRFLMIQPDPAEFAGSHVNVVLNWFEEVRAKMASK